MANEEALAQQREYATQLQRTAIDVLHGSVRPDVLMQQREEAEAREARYHAEEVFRIDREMRGQALTAALHISGQRGGDPDAVLADARAFYAFLAGEKQ